MRISRLVGAPLLAVVLAGCSIVAPDTSPTPTETSAPSPAPEAQAIVEVRLGGIALVAYDADREVARVGLDDPDAVVDLLADALGDPEISELSAEAYAEGCRATRSSWDSGGVVARVWPDDVVVVSVGVVAVDGVSFASSTGLAVGDDASSVIAALPSEQVDAGGVAFLFDVAGERADGELFGGVAFHDGAGIVQSLVTPFVAVATDTC